MNGEILDARLARVSVLDNGFAFGESVYETLRTYAGRPFALERHLLRLRASAERLAIGIPLDDAELGGRVSETLARAGNAESYVRIIVSRGVGDFSYHVEHVAGPTVVVIVKPLEPFPARFWSEGVPVVLASVRRNHPRALDPAIKSSNLLNNALAIREAYAQGAAEAILLNQDGEIAEGASSNLFVVHGETLRTPALGSGLLAGITRAVVLELADALGIPRREEPLHPDDLASADEAFVTSTLKELMPVVRVGERAVGAGVPGPVTRRLLEAYRRRVVEQGR